MSFGESINRVKRAELALDANVRAVGGHWRRLRRTWREAWTPGRIVVAGLASGFVVGLGELPKATGSGFINLFSAVGGLFAVEQADTAQEAASDAADQVQQVAGTLAEAAGVDDDDPVRAHEAMRRSGAW